MHRRVRAFAPVLFRFKIDLRGSWSFAFDDLRRIFEVRQSFKVTRDSVVVIMGRVLRTVSGVILLG